MNCEFLAEARDELWNAASYYESREQGLGMRFRNEAEHILHQIVADPYRGWGVLYRRKHSVRLVGSEEKLQVTGENSRAENSSK